MSHSFRYDPDLDCILVFFEDTVTVDLVGEVAPRVARLSAETGCLRILTDMSSATIDVSISDVFSLPQVMDQSNMPRTTKRALVVPDSFAEGHFLETVSRNRGHDLRVFRDAEDAKRWLLGDG